jgi:hypothetical protein
MNITGMNTQKVARILTTTLPGLFAFGLAAATAAPALAQAPGTWAYTGTMPMARQFHTATLLDNGLVLVAGGCQPAAACEADDAGALFTAELYDPSTGTWTPTGNMPSGRFGHTATLLDNGAVLVTGGYSTNSIRVLKSALLYDPSTGTWSDTGSMTVARIYHCAVLLPNGEVLISGGETKLALDDTPESPTNTAEIYNPSTGTFTATGGMNDARFGAQLTLLQNGDALIAGGGTGDAGCTAEFFSNGQWTLTSPLAVCGVSQESAALLRSGDVLIGAGANSQFYDPSTNVWQPTLGAADINIGPLALLDTGEVLVAGETPALIAGEASPAEPGSSTSALYDPSTNEWTPTGSLEQSLNGLTLTPLSNGKVLAVGGDPGETNDRTELFTP